MYTCTYKKVRLRTGDIIVGNTRIRNQNEKFSALLYMKSVNGYNRRYLHTELNSRILHLYFLIEEYILRQAVQVLR